jgi:integral membrane protein (TIGR01906 family)
MRIAIRIMAIVFAVILCFVFLISSIRYVAFNQDIYKRIQEKQKIAEFVLMNQDELDDITKGLIDYMKGDRNDLVIYRDYDGQENEVFNEREKKHMVDVRMLFELSLSVVVALLGLLALIIISGMLIDMDIMKKIFMKTVAITMVIVVLFLIMLIFYMIVDFYNFWLFFHEIVFTNDLYFLDPYTDILINIMPMDFFIVICLNVSLYFGLLFGGSFAIMYGTKVLKRIVNHE